MTEPSYTPDSQWTPMEAAEADVRATLRNAQKANEPRLQSLVTPEDPDWEKFSNDDPEWFLRAAGRAIRKYCGWHLFPNERHTVRKIRTGARGIVMLPSRHVTEVESLFIQPDEDHPPHLVPDHDYVWHAAGYIERKGWSYYAGWQYNGYYYGNDPYYAPVWGTEFAACTFWHGWSVLPDDIKQVAFELAEQAMTVHAGNLKMLEAPGGFRAMMSQPFGLSLNDDQMARLSSYRIGMVG